MSPNPIEYAEPVAEARGVRRSFGDTVALDGVDLEVTAGESVGLLGPNGAGKTTLISMLTGLRRPDAGEVRIFGMRPDDPRARLRLGVTPQATAVPPTLRVSEVVDFVATHYADPMPTGELLEQFSLDDEARTQTGGLSGGQQRRLLVALALVGRPDLVVLDEPTTGLDVSAREALWESLRHYGSGGGTLLITSHYLAEIEALASRVVVVDHGRVIGDGTVAEITARVDLTHLRLRTSASDAELAGLEAVVEVERDGDSVQLASRDSDATVRSLVASGLGFSALTIAGASLEEAFVTMTSATPSTSHAA